MAKVLVDESGAEVGKSWSMPLRVQLKRNPNGVAAYRAPNGRWRCHLDYHDDPARWQRFVDAGETRIVRFVERT